MSLSRPSGFDVDVVARVTLVVKDGVAVAGNLRFREPERNHNVASVFFNQLDRAPALPPDALELRGLHSRLTVELTVDSGVRVGWHEFSPAQASTGSDGEMLVAVAIALAKVEVGRRLKSAKSLGE